MTDNEITRLEKLLGEYYGQTIAQISELRAVVTDTANRVMVEESRLGRLESWRAREAKDTTTIYDLIKEQTKLLEELSRQEAARRGAYSVVRFIGIVGVPALGVLAGAIIWLIQHAK